MPAGGGRLILAIDQGTTSSRAILFDEEGRPLATAQKALPQHFPADGWVEHDPLDIWNDTLAVCREALARGRATAADLAAIGITNQRETTLLWDRQSGAPVHRAIVWQDRRTAPACRRLDGKGAGPLIAERTGLLLDPYFSATKIAWLLDNVPGARARAEKGELAFGTVDSWLLWNLTGGAVHATDATNASRTMLFDIGSGAWDPQLLALFRLPAEILPEVKDCAAHFGESLAHLLGAAVPIRGIAGDQQAALVGQACLKPGMVKSTYGTGCFALAHMGGRPVASRNRLLGTIAYQLDGERSYALEGAIFNAGTAVQWLRDGLGLIVRAAETEALALSVADSGGVYLVPAFTGLGAPWWDANARGAILGITRDTSRAQIVRAALEAQAYQTRDLLDAMAQDSGRRLAALRVDGGLVANDFVCQMIADICEVAVERPAVTETTALGAAMLAGLGSGLLPSLDRHAARWRAEHRFEPAMPADRRESLLAGWRTAVRRVLSDAARG
ncbi:MAG: glycerol kinase GlpK [Alphaproteobacteria bacterium]|nr:glycerol kinase GlpK [Alphaproteobacteria bacterium]